MIDVDGHALPHLPDYTVFLLLSSINVCCVGNWWGHGDPPVVVRLGTLYLKHTLPMNDKRDRENSTQAGATGARTGRQL